MKLAGNAGSTRGLGSRNWKDGISVAKLKRVVFTALPKKNRMYIDAQNFMYILSTTSSGGIILKEYYIWGLEPTTILCLSVLGLKMWYIIQAHETFQSDSADS